MSKPSDRSGAAPAANRPRGAGERTDRKSERPSARPGGSQSLVGLVLGGRYFIERLIGEGGMGAVYQAEHTHMRKRLAVKVLHPEMSRLAEVVVRFEREAMAAAHIDHPNVAAATDFGKLDDGSFFLVLEYVEGRSLRDAIASRSLDLGSALHIGRQIASALGRAHAIGIVHRDLKPENVMLVTREGDPHFVKVLDFGIAKVPVGELFGDSKAPGQILTQLGMVYGTPEYMAPEQALGQSVDARADLYALGVILFEIVTGVRPYDHESKVTLLGMHVTASIPRMSERAPGANVPPEVEAIVTRLLAKEAGARFADARDLIDALDHAGGALAAQGRLAEPIPSQSLIHPPRASGPRFSGVDVTSPAASAALGGARGGTRPADGALRQLVAQLEGSLAGVRGGSPPWARLPVVVASLGGVAAMILLAFAIGRGASSSASAGLTAGAPEARPPPVRSDPKIDDAITGAQANLEKGDFATAIDELSSIEKTNPDRADVHMGLEKAYTGVRNGREAMREAGLWLASDATAASDLKLQEDIRNAALVKETQEEAFALLESRMGPRGIDILYDIAYGSSGRLYPQAAARARRSLLLVDVRGRASAALGVLLDLREARACEAKRALLGRARDAGDARLLPMLTQFQAPKGCGFLGAADCFPCMHHDGALSDAIAAVEQRAAKTP